MIIRRARPEDAEAIARVRVDTWRTTYEGILPQKYLDSLSYEKTAFTWRAILAAEGRQGEAFVAEREGGDQGGEVVGFAIGGVERSGQKKYEGEVYAVYVRQAYQGSGLGKRLVAEVAHTLSEKGMRSLLIWALAENPARRFYERLGGQPVGEKETVIGNQRFSEVAYGWTDLRPLLAAREAASTAPGAPGDT